MPIFTEASSLVRAVEAELVGERESGIRLFAYLQRLIWFPLKFLKIGISEKTKGASLWAYLASAFLVLGAWVINNSGIAHTEVANAVLWVAMIAPMFLVVFSMPSLYGNSGIAPSAVRFVAEHLQSRGFSSASDVELLKKSVKPFEERARARVTVLKWLVGLLWAGFIYMLAKSMELPLPLPSHFLSYAQASAWLLACTFFAYLVVWDYEASLDKLFRAIEFGCNDFCHLAQRSEHES